MKLHFKLFPIFLSVIIIFLSIFQCSITAYASSGGGHSRPGYDENDKFLGKYDNIGDFLLQESDKLIAYIVGQTKAIYSGDFSTVVQNDELFEEYFNPEHITYSDDIDGNGTSGFVFDEDLTSYMKQALIEYAEETNGFKIIPTTNYLSVPLTLFKNSYSYRTFMALVQESECLAIMNIKNSELRACRPFNAVDTPISLVNTRYYFRNLHEVMYVGTYSWEVYRPEVFTFDSMVYDTDKTLYYQEYHSFIEGTPLSNTNVYSSLIGYEVMNHGSISENGWILYSIDGRKFKVFNNVNALKNYTTGNRSVYFGSGFYDDPGEIQVSFDDLEKYIDGKYDSFFDDLKDLIGDNEDNLTEEDLEKLVDKILDKMDDIGGNNKPGDNTGDNSGILDGIADILEGITSAISGYLDAILMYLESILTDLDYIVLEMQDMTEEEVSTKSDSVITELSDAFSEIGDVMSQKFPFSIPWDIKNLYVALSGGKEPGIQSLSDDIGIGGLYHDSSPPSASSGKLIDVIVYPSPDDGTMPLVADEDIGNITPVPPSGDASFTDSGAPVFKIPFVIRSAGVNAAVLLDMSYFDTVSAFSRTLFLLIFLHQLFLLSMRVFEFVKSFMG